MFDLTQLTKVNSFYEIKGNDSKEKLLFNFCKPFDASTDKEFKMCEPAERYGYLIDKIGEPGMKCEPLTEKVLGSKVNVTEFTEGNDKGIQFEFPKSEKPCGTRAPGQNFGLIVKAYCAKNVTTDQVDKFEFNRELPGTCTQVYTVNSGAACPKIDLDALYEFLSKYKVLWGFVFIVLGMFISYFGRKMIKPTVFVITFVLVTFVLGLLLYTLFMKYSHP